MSIDFLYLSEKDMIEAGVLDAARCIETMRDAAPIRKSAGKRQTGPAAGRQE